jgi:hypothetical protein
MLASHANDSSEISGKYLSVCANAVHNSLFSTRCILDGCSANVRFCLRLTDEIWQKIQKIKNTSLVGKCIALGNDDNNKLYVQNNENAYFYWSQLFKYSRGVQRNRLWCPHELILTFDPNSFRIVSQWGKYDSCVLNIPPDKLAKYDYKMYYVIKKTFQHKVIFDLPKVKCDDKILEIVSSCVCADNLEKHEIDAINDHNFENGNNFAVNDCGELVNFKDKTLTTLVPQIFEKNSKVSYCLGLTRNF